MNRRAFLAGAAAIAAAPTFGKETATMTQIDRAVFYCGEAACFAAGTSDHADPRFRFQLAVALTNYLHTNVSAAKYTWDAKRDGANFVPPASPEEALERGIGACGNIHDVGRAVLDVYKIATRTVQAFWGRPDGTRRNHIMLEMELEPGIFGVLDPLYGFLAKRRGGTVPSLLSYDEIRHGCVPYAPLINQVSPWTQRLTPDAPDPVPFEHYTADPCDVLLDYVGVIHPYITADAAVRDFSLVDSMPVLGRMSRNPGTFGNIEFEIDVPASLPVLVIWTSGGAGTGALTVNGARLGPMPAPPYSAYYKIPSGRVRLGIAGAGPCYVGVDKIRLQAS